MAVQILRAQPKLRLAVFWIDADGSLEGCQRTRIIQ